MPGEVDERGVALSRKQEAVGVHCRFTRLAIDPDDIPARADAPRRSQAAGNVQRRELPAVQQKSMAAARGIHEISDHIATGVDAPRRRRCRVRVRNRFIAVGRGRSRRRSVERRVACSEGGSLDVFRTTAGEQRGGCDGCGGEGCSRVSAHGGSPYETLRVFLRMKSIRMNCPSVIVFVK